MILFKDDMRGDELKELYRAIWRLAWPASFAMLVRQISMFILRVLSSQLGEKAYNSVNIGLIVFMIIVTVIGAIAVGTVALVAQSWGAGKREQAGRVLQQSLLWGLILSLIIPIVGIPASGLLYGLQTDDPETIRLGTTFMIYLFAAVPVLVPGFFLAAGLRAAGDTRTPMIGGIIMGITSLVLSYALILGKLGAPALGVTGAALALDGGFAAFTLFLGVLFIFNKTKLKLPLRGWKLNTEIGKSIFKIGIPSAFEWIMIQVGIFIYIIIINRYGDEAAAGYFTGLALLGFAQAPCQGFQQATATLVGQAVGANDYNRAESAFRHSALLSFIFMIGMGVMFYIIVNPTILTFMFGKLSPQTLVYARQFVLLLIFVMPLMGVTFSMAGGFRGAGDTVPPLVASAVGVFGGRILIAVTLYVMFHPPVFIIWCSMFPDLILRTLIMAVRLKSGKWKKARI